ncbi:acyltransferase [Photobacterium alginatilyticum]|uniref:acyltransferase n=1 Tax=Photobacterium alginatilyticum TaxID=1775171 RepID=UPI0040699134
MNNILFKIRNRVRLSGTNSVSISRGARIRKCDISIKGNNNKLIIKNGVNIKGSKIEINGNNCSIIFEENTVIGENCYFSSREKDTLISIGKNSMFSRNIKLMTSDGHDIFCDEKRINPAKSIIIGEHVWLADSVTVLKGCNIGDGSVVGINSLVTKDIGENKIAAGVPAVEIKDNIHWDEKLTFS